METETVKTIILEDGNKYIIADEIIVNGIKYVYMAMDNNSNNLVVRKTKIINEHECLVGLDSNEELKQALTTFQEKHHD